MRPENSRRNACNSWNSAHHSRACADHQERAALAKLVPAENRRRIFWQLKERSRSWETSSLQSHRWKTGMPCVDLLDTHVLVWAVADPKSCPRAAAAAIRRVAQDGWFGHRRYYTLGIGVPGGSGTHPQSHGTVENIGESVRSIGVTVKPITPEIAALATQFPNDYPHDPVDRLIGATARAEGLALVTRDENIRKSPLLKTIW